MKVLLVCSGRIDDYSCLKKYIEESEYIISVDGGANHIKKFNTVPNLMIGDFDSIDKDVLLYFKNKGIETIDFPTDKDKTDTELAIDMAISKKASEIVILGALGNRYDHTMANVYLLKKILDNNVEGVLVDEKNEIRMMSCSIKVNGENGGKLSLIPVTEVVKGITTKGLLYSLDNYELEFGTSRGISNEFLDDNASITIKSGMLLVIKSNDINFRN